MTNETKIELTSIQLMLNKHSQEILEKEDINFQNRNMLIAHNDFIIEELEKLKQTK